MPRIFSLLTLLALEARAQKDPLTVQSPQTIWGVWPMLQDFLTYPASGL